MKPTRFAVYAWVTLAYTVAVIVWGAFVRASGSGAGCGSHWPSCDGQIVPRGAAIATTIEFTHRVMSGLSLLVVLALLIWAFRAFPRRHPARLGALFSTVFIVIEALIGAALVLLSLTGTNDSVSRAVMLAVHLVNTFLLLGSVALTAWWGAGGQAVQWRALGGRGWPLAVALLGMLVVGAAGAVTALGDTLFPAGSLADGIQQDLSPTAHFLVQLRVIHPSLAVVTSIFIFLLGSRLARTDDGTLRRLSQAMMAVVGAQLVGGFVNLALLAPIPMQLFHLLMADVLWLALVLTTAAALPAPTTIAATDEIPPLARVAANPS